MKKIYGNHQLIETLRNMVKKNQTARTVLFFGEKGVGKKTIADYYIHMLMCEKALEERPCFECRTCRNISNEIHPDVITAEKSGKTGIYSVETARKICSDSFIKPNNSDKKIYIFKDCDNMDERTQNTLLKIIEEPPEYAYFIFTSESKSKFLPTVISRCMCFGVSECSETECRLALSETGKDDFEIKSAIECFHGNIGMCKLFLSDEKLRENIRLTKLAVDSIINKDEYEFMLSISEFEKERENIKSVLIMLDRIIRDAIVLNYGENKILGCYPKGSRRLSEIITLSSGIKLHRLIEKACYSVEANVNINLILSSLCGQVAEILKF